jgi:hypothetical protein
MEKTKRKPASQKETALIILNTYNDADEIIQSPPGWLVQSGLGLIAIAIAIGICLMWFLKYPEYIEAKVTISSPFPPVEYYTATEGFVKKIYATEGQKLEEGMPVAYIGLNEQVEDIQIASNWASECIGKASAPPQNLKLGELANSWLALCTAWENFHLYNQAANPKFEINFLNQEKNYTQLLDSLSRFQNRLSTAETNLIAQSFERDQSLFGAGIISRQEFEHAELGMNKTERQNLLAQENIIFNQLKINQIEKEQHRIAQGFGQRLADLHIQLRQAIAVFELECTQWDKAHIVRATTNGRLSLIQGLHVNQYVQKGLHLATLAHDTSEQYFVALGKAPEFGAGKIVPGNNMKISLNAFPVSEWGYVEAKVTRMASLPGIDREMGAFYAVEARLGQQLYTDRGKQLPFQQNLNGTARITTHHQRLLYRMMGQLYKAIEKFNISK